MANLTIERHYTTPSAQSASPADFTDTSSNAPAAPVSAAATQDIRIASIYAYFGAGVGYRLVRVAIQERPDATVLAMVLPCGETARIWAYPHGVGVQVQSASHPNIWHEVTSRHCTCMRFAYRHSCRHMIAAEEALAVWERWQQYSAVSAQKEVA